MSAVRRATYTFGVVNVAIGICGFSGPLVGGNHDRLVNVSPGYLFGLFAMNWPRWGGAGRGGRIST